MIMSSSSIGSGVFAGISTLFISGLVLLLLRHFMPLRTSPAYLLVPVFLAVTLPASLILLLPIDIASSVSQDERRSAAVRLPEAVILVSWRITYWLCFALTWYRILVHVKTIKSEPLADVCIRLVLPLLGEYVDSGERSVRGRLTYSAWSNARYYAIVLGCCIAGLVYFSVQQGVNPLSLKALLVALAYWWGLALAIYLMGHGLVAIPRRLFRDASPSKRLTTIYETAPSVHDKLDDALQSLDELEAQVAELRRRKHGVPALLRDWIEDLANESTKVVHTTSNGTTSAASGSSVPSTVTDTYLAALTRKLARARHKKARFLDSWGRLVDEAVETQAIVDSAASRRLTFDHQNGGSSSWHRLSLLTPYTRHLLYYRITPAFRYLFGALFALASICIVWSEITKLISSKLSVVNMVVLSHPFSQHPQLGFRGQITAAAWLVYMCAAALTSIYDAKVWGNRALVRRNTYGESACWYASQVARLTFPLAYNFLTFLSPNMYQRTGFYHFLGRLIDLTPLGKGFSDFLPVLVLVPVCATLFGIYGRTARLLGLSGYRDDETDEETGFGVGTARWREGRDLIERELSDGSTLGHLALAGRSSRPLEPQDTSRTPYSDSQPSPEPHEQSSRGSRSQVPSIPSSAGGTGDRAHLINTATNKTTDHEAEDEQAEENAFSEFAHRVRNTFDVAETPRWMRNLGNTLSNSRPKWMTYSSSSPTSPSSPLPTRNHVDGHGDDASGLGDSIFGRLFNQGGRTSSRSGPGRIRL